MKKIMALVLMVVLTTVGCSNGPVEDMETIRATYEAQVEQLENEVTALKGDLEVSATKLTDKEAEIAQLLDNLQVVEEEKAALMTDYQGLQSENEELMSNGNAIPPVVLLSEIIVELIRDQDFATLATYVHPTNGVRFTPYPYINLGTDLVMSTAQVSAFGTDPTVYYWGDQDGSGDPLNLTPMDYYSTYVYNADFANPETMSWNAPVGYGNMINNLPSVYPTADYVEFHFSGFNPSFSGMDWTGLTLVFEQVGPDWYLVGIVHGQWTT